MTKVMTFCCLFCALCIHHAVLPLEQLPEVLQLVAAMQQPSPQTLPCKQQAKQGCQQEWAPLRQQQPRPPLQRLLRLLLLAGCRMGAL